MRCCRVLMFPCVLVFGDTLVEYFCVNPYIFVLCISYQRISTRLRDTNDWTFMRTGTGRSFQCDMSVHVGGRPVGGVLQFHVKVLSISLFYASCWNLLMDQGDHLEMHCCCLCTKSVGTVQSPADCQSLQQPETGTHALHREKGRSGV